MRVVAALCLSFILYGNVHGQVTRVEEDWELRVSHPDEQIDAPQVQVALFPFGQDVDVQLQLDLNHASYPGFSAGGVQLLMWSGGECVASNRIHEGVRLSVPNETLAWTSYVESTGSELVFGIKDGSSVSLGNFGGPSDQVSVPFSQLNAGSLANYRHVDSRENSGVPFSSNRVQHLRLKKIRIYQASGSFIELPINLDVEKPVQ